MLGEFAVFLREIIKRVITTGITLLAVALADAVDGPDAACNTHNISTLRVRSRSVRFMLIAMFGTATYSPGRRLIEVCV